jgi:hypothetical protein
MQMRAEVVLTVAESKRLIAKGIAALKLVQDRMKNGMIVLTTGSTNAYIYEELVGRAIDKRAYVTGRTVPAKAARPWKVDILPDLVLVNGQPTPELGRFTALERMKEGDVYIKGANALNYRQGIAGITIGHPAGGTIGGALGTIIGRKLQLLIPVSLEKEVPFDIQRLSDLAAMGTEPGLADEHIGTVYPLWPVHGRIFTEIEAFKTLCGVEAYPIAAGGIAGAEGGRRMLLLGEADAVRQAVTLTESIQGEPPLG